MKQKLIAKMVLGVCSTTVFKKHIRSIKRPHVRAEGPYMFFIHIVFYFCIKALQCPALNKPFVELMI